MAWRLWSFLVLKKLMLAIEYILNLWKVFDKYFMIYISATAALYSKMYSLGMTLVIRSFYKYVNTNCSVYCLDYKHPWWGIIFRNVCRVHCFVKLFNVPVGFVPASPILSCVLLYLRSPKGGCCSISDDLSCSWYFYDLSTKGGCWSLASLRQMYILWEHGGVLKRNGKWHSNSIP